MEVSIMRKHLEYAIMIFMAALLLILFRWSENGRYNIHIAYRQVTKIDTRIGDIWVHSPEKEGKWRRLPSIHE